MLVEISKTPSNEAASDLTREEACAAARAIVNLLDKWQLTDDQARQILGGMPQRTWARWKAGDIGRIDRDLATRLSLLLGIHKALRCMFGRSVERAYAWVKADNDAFGGQSALQVMLRGQIIDLYGVRQYLDAERSGW